jgi:site-specific DNA recombinase
MPCPEEAETVRRIFDLHREARLGAAAQAGARQTRDPLEAAHRSQRLPCWWAALLARALYALLSNPVYIGEIAHKGARYPGQHAVVLARQTWNNVQEQLRNPVPGQRRRTAGTRSPLVGKLLDKPVIV